MIAVLSKNEEKQLREALSRTFLDGYPNPERRGCPGTDTLRAIAFEILTLEEAEPWIYHLSSCSPCTREFCELRKSHRRWRALRFYGIAASAVLAAGILAWFLVKVSFGPARLQPVTVDLTAWATVRGAESNPPNPPVQLARGYFDMTVYLPVGSEPGIYEIQVLREPDQPIWSARREVKLENYKATLRVQIDLRRFSPGLYLLAFRQQDRSWTYIPMVLK